jgi:hypothetical protein
MVVAIEVVPLVATFVMVGGTGFVAKVEFPDVADPFPVFAEVTSKSYVVPGVRPVSVTE